MNVDLQAVVETLISSAASQKAKIEDLQRDLAKAFREIERLRRVAGSQKPQESASE